LEDPYNFVSVPFPPSPCLPPTGFPVGPGLQAHHRASLDVRPKRPPLLLGLLLRTLVGRGSQLGLQPFHPG
jgi:hypothetical protein